MRIHSIHNGCEANWADSDAAKQGFLKDSGFKYSDKENADYIIFHGCTFTQHKEDETKNTILELLNSTTKKIIISGCFLKEYVQHERVQYIKNEKLPAFIESLQQEIKSKAVAEQVPKHSLLPFVAISRGCYGNCTFCSIKQAKGSNVSRKIEEILIDIEARQDLEYIKLVGDEVAGYGREIGLNLKILVDAIIEKFPSIKLKFGSLNCKLLKKYKKEELAIFAYPNVIGNVHIPIQSASNSVLQTMSRGYTIEEYTAIYNTLKSLGVANISADIICGFPGESEEDHKRNLDYIVQNQFEFMEIFAYQERDGTKAATFEQMDYSIRKNRAIQLIVNYIKGYGKWHNLPFNTLVKQQKVFNTNIKFN